MPTDSSVEVTEARNEDCPAQADQYPHQSVIRHAKPPYSFFARRKISSKMRSRTVVEVPSAVATLNSVEPTSFAWKPISSISPVGEPMAIVPPVEVDPIV